MGTPDASPISRMYLRVVCAEKSVRAKEGGGRADEDVLPGGGEGVLAGGELWRIRVSEVMGEEGRTDLVSSFES